MILFTRSLLAMANQKCRHSVTAIAKNLANSGICNYQDCMDAVEEEDSIKINDWLEKAIITYTGEENTIYGLRKYCEKFAIPIDKEFPNEKELLMLIDANSAKIEQELGFKGDNHGSI